MAIQDYEINIKQNCAYPSQLDPFSKKETPEFGLALGDAISSEWFSRISGGSSCKFYTNQREIQERRIYAAGKVDARKYYPRLGTNGDTSLLNLPKQLPSRIPKIVDLVVNGFCNRNYSIKFNAIDPISNNNKQEYRKKIEDDRNAMPIIQQAKEQFGFDISSMPVEELPETDEELEIHMQMKWKPSNCLSNELAIASVFKDNDYNLTTEKLVYRNLVVDGICWVKNRFNGSKGILIEHVDPINKIQSYTKDPYFRDCFYHGEVKQTLISDILVEYPHMNTAEYASQKERLLVSGDQWYRYHNIPDQEQLKGVTHLLYFTYKTTRERVKKIIDTETGGKDVAEFIPTQNKKKDYRPYKTTSMVDEVLFEGVMVLGTNILLKWEVAKSMSRPKSNKQKVCEQYIGVAPNYMDGDFSSLVSRMMPTEDELNVLELKALQIIQGITPDGIAIDLDAIAEIDLGKGPVGANDMLNMYLQKGSYFYRSYGQGGEFNNAQKPFQEIRTGDSINKLTALRNESNIKITELTDVVGLNKASDASTPDKNSLVGIQKLAALNTNTATRHILDGFGFVTLKTSEAASYRVSDIMNYYPSLKEDLIRKIGETAVIDLDYVKDFHLSDFAIYLQMDLDDEERAMLNADLSMAIEKGYIVLSDKYEIINIKVLSLAIQYLNVLIKKNQKKTQEQEAQKFKLQADENIRAAQESEKAKQETLVIGHNFKMKELAELAKTESKKETTRGEQDRLTEDVKGENAIELQYIINSGAVQKTETVEAKKDEREVKADTRASRMIDQRKKEAQPIDFEAEEADMETFQLNE